MEQSAVILFLIAFFLLILLTQEDAEMMEISIPKWTASKC